MIKSLKKILLFCCVITLSTLVTANTVINYTKAPNVESLSPFNAKEVTPKTAYESNLYLSMHSATPGAIINTEIIQLDAQNK